MGELEAAHLRRLGYEVLVDEPYQRYQFSGRADLLAVDHAWRALLHVENKTRITDVQEVAGSYGTRKAYLAGIIAERIGLRRGFDSDLWVGGEAIAEIRPRHRDYAAALAALRGAGRA